MKWLSILLSAIVGGSVAAVAAWGVVTSNTAAPHHNPAQNTSSIIGYGSK
ncbi:MAG TPA: hypothetical protein VGN35_00730 [Jatrophihabitantaceae bacterium]|jgi:hypothetical protein|nr:hypothetical protein [Jatrophihabitantaceae bacterium]